MYGKIFRQTDRERKEINRPSNPSYRVDEQTDRQAKRYQADRQTERKKQTRRTNGQDRQTDRKKQTERNRQRDRQTNNKIPDRQTINISL